VSQGALSLRFVLQALLEFGAQTSLVESGEPTKYPKASSRIRLVPDKQYDSKLFDPFDIVKTDPDIGNRWFFGRRRLGKG
jgi:hypothetical protein